MKTRYKFSHRSSDGLTYYWISTHSTTGDSRVEQVWCPVSWFWGGAKNGAATRV